MYDVSIIGSGPAAISAAIVLAQCNFNIIVFCENETRLAKGDFGETLSHSVIPSLGELGVLSLFQKLKLEPITGSVSSWGTEKMEETPALLHPFGIGWVQQKHAFNRILIERSTSLGACFSTDQISRVERKNEVWKIFTERGGSIASELMIIATGRDNPRFAKLSKKVSLDKLVACIVTLEEDSRDSLNFVSIDSSENGWYFSVKSDEKTRVLSYFTDGDLLRYRDLQTFLQSVNQHLLDLPSMSKAIKRIDIAKVKSFRIVCANSTFRKNFFTKGLFCCGDSAQTFDPLSSQGVSAAIRDGIETAKFLARLDCGNKESMIEYERRRRQQYLEYLKNWGNIYSTERRWIRNVFWQRRQHLQYVKTFINTVCE
ncbi:FAD-dependent monooxygenase [Methylomicrobium sp. Wu6]|uniref:FAD-dependent oxidoreductase n=1 Tax=Methylomicrobium sp. Wu6 TaxID=3107928 RepID=UPI002DD6A764|nr:FAD-dependent monooxygenase [Methylomicrobium sp. Wu6]